MVPIPIERIVDNALRIDIVPVPNLQRDFDTVGFTASDLSAIYVDAFVQDRIEPRYRFTLAHEVGHIVLHADFWKSRRWNSIAEWKRSIEEIPDDAYRFMEWHANAFAGLVLVPPLALASSTVSCVRKVQSYAAAARHEPEAYREFVELCLAEEFKVSHAVIQKRMRKDAVALRE